MKTWLRNLAFGSLILSVLPLGGCQLALFTITIPDFGSKAVEGVWLWRLSPTTGAYVRDTQFSFVGAVTPAAGGETIDYSASTPDGSPPVPITTYISRDASQPDRVTLQLIYSRMSDPGYYRASTYNSSGDSPLTNEIVPL